MQQGVKRHCLLPYPLFAGLTDNTFKEDLNFINKLRHITYVVEHVGHTIEIILFILLSYTGHFFRNKFIY